MMRSPPRAWTTRATLLVLAAILTAAQAAVFMTPLPPERVAVRRTSRSHAARPPHLVTSAWIYGHSAARFALIEYADLECAYCANSFERVRQWIDAHGDVSWHWRHLPLRIHEPRATEAARRVHCIGTLKGNEAFWKAVADHYAHLQGAMAPTGANPEGLKECLKSPRTDAALRADVEEATHLNVVATPTFVLRDQHTGQQIMLKGAPEESLLLSAVDALLAASPI